MKKFHLIAFVFIVFVSCNGNDKETPVNSTVDSAEKETPTPATANTAKHVDWEIGDPNNVNKIMELYKLWDEKNISAATEYFADTMRVNMPEVSGEIVVPNKDIFKRLGANRAMYKATANDVLSSVSLRDKVTGENWVMVTAYSKWIEADGKIDSLLYHDDWRLVNGKIDRLISFYKLPPKGFRTEKKN